MQSSCSPLLPRKGRTEEMFYTGVEEEVRALSHPRAGVCSWLHARRMLLGGSLCAGGGEVRPGVLLGCSPWPQPGSGSPVGGMSCSEGLEML